MKVPQSFESSENTAVITAPQYGGSGFDSRYSFWKFSILLFLLAAFSSPGLLSATNRSEYQGVSLGVKSSRRAERHNMEVPASIPGIGFRDFQVSYSFWPHSVALDYSQPLTEVSTREYRWVLRAVGAWS